MSISNKQAVEEVSKRKGFKNNFYVDMEISIILKDVYVKLELLKEIMCDFDFIIKKRGGEELRMCFSDVSEITDYHTHNRLISEIIKLLNGIDSSVFELVEFTSENGFGKFILTGCSTLSRLQNKYTWSFISRYTNE